VRDTFEIAACTEKGGFACFKDGILIGAFGITNLYPDDCLTVGVKIMELAELDFDPAFYRPHITCNLLKSN
jgi:hypothetical protein